MTILFRLTVALSMLGWLGCGGCDGHLKYTINDSLLADVPLAEKQAMLDVKDEQAQIQQIQTQARSEQTVSTRDLAAADAEVKIAQQEIAKTQADVDLAKSTTDLNRMSRAKARLTVAELGRSTAETKMEWRRLRVGFAEQRERVLAQQAKYEEARYEQEKARLAAAKGKRPYENFALGQFDLQVAEAQARWNTERVKSDKLQQALMQIENHYQQLQSELASARRTVPSQAVPPASPLSSMSQ